MRSSPPLLYWDAQRPMLTMATCGMYKHLLTAAPTSGAWPSANRAYYLPFHTPAAMTVKRLWVMVGTTGGTDQVDMGLYDAAGNRLVSIGTGTTVGTASQVQFLNITDTTIAPGDYYVGIAYNGVTAHVFSRTAATTDLARLTGVLVQNTAFALPNPATFAALATGLVPIAGLCTTASP